MTNSLNSTHRSAFAVIHAPVLYSQLLSDAEKIIYGHVSNLCNEAGYCYATNNYLAELSGKSLATIKRAIKKLEDLNFVEIQHISKGIYDQRQITLSQYPKTDKKGGGSFLSYPQLKNELPGGSKMSHIIIKEEYTNKNTTTTSSNFVEIKPIQAKVSSSFLTCKNKIQQLEDLAISFSQKQKIYRDFDESQILKGLKWLSEVKTRDNPGAALYDALKHSYEPKKNPEELINTNQKYAQIKLGKYENQVIKGFQVNLCKQYVEFAAPTGKSYYFPYSQSSFKCDLDNFCIKVAIKK